MHRLALVGTFGILLAALYFSWQYRFERSTERSPIRLAELRSDNLPPGAKWQGPEDHPSLRLTVDRDHPEVVTHLEFPEISSVDFLHLRFQLRARDLRPGAEIWQDGRCLIEWHSPSGGTAWEADPFCSVRLDQTETIMDRVMRPENPPAVPALRFENLGIQGDLEISELEATVLRERKIWKIGRWILMAAWLVWVMAWIGVKKKSGFPRTLTAAIIMLLMVLYFVVPGPWKIYQPFGTSFEIGREIIKSPVVSTINPTRFNIPSTSTHSVSLKSVGKIPDKGDFTLRLKHYLTKARPLLHMAMLFAPALALACLVGRRSALSLSAILAIATEAAQYAFGYGFDWMDIYDLACDATGIIIALWVHQRLKRRFPHIVSS